MAGSDFSIDFAAAAPQIYDHDTGGGAFEDKTINLDAVESLEGGDFAVGDIVSYYFNVITALNAVDQFPQTIDVDVSFLVNTTGQTGVSHRDIVGVTANYFTGELSDYEDPTSFIQIISDSGAIDDDSTTAWIVPGTEIYENKVTGEVYADYDTAATNQGAVVSATVRINDLEPGERVVLRIDTLLDAIPGSTPTGNLQGFVTGARVVSPTDDPVINLGNQTIPFKLTGEISGIPEPAPGLTLEKVVTTDMTTIGTIQAGDLDLNGDGMVDEEDDFNGDGVNGDELDYYEVHKNEEVTVRSGTTVRYLYEITNIGNIALADFILLDDLDSSTSFVNDDRNKLESSNPDDDIVADITNGMGSPIGYITNAGLLYGGFLDGTVGTNGANDLSNTDDGITSYDDRTTIIYYDVTIPSSTPTSTITNTATAVGYATMVNGNNESKEANSVVIQDTANVNVIGTTDTVLSGYSYLDLNNNGTKDAGESGIAGVEITLSNGDETTTDVNGFYSFTGLTAGTYTITQSQPLNYYDGQETTGLNNGGTGGGGTVDNTMINNTITSVDIQANNYYSDYNFGELLPADISGVAYYDLNGDGDRQDTDTGRSGIQVTLTGTNDFGEAVNETTTTDSSGRYYFGGLRPGLYIDVGDPGNESYTISFQTSPGDVGTGDVGEILGTNLGPNSGNIGTDQITDIFLGAGSSGINYDYGVDPDDIGGTISGTVFQDTGIYVSGSLTGTDNGTINDTDADSFSTTPATGEKRIAGVTITLYDDITDAFVAETTTDINGNYSFTGLAAGTYRVEETQPQYFDPSANDGQGDLVNYIDGKETSPTGNTATDNEISNLVISGSTTHLTGNNFAELPPASISGYVFLDTLRDRVYGLDENESITVDGTTYTNNGNSFANFTIPVRNGEFDDDEFGIGGIDIRLTGTTVINEMDVSVDITETTDSEGYYRFKDLRPPKSGTSYTVTQKQPVASSGYVDGEYDNNSDKTFSEDEVNPGNVLGTSNGSYDDPAVDTPDVFEDNFSGIDLNFGQSGVEYNFPEITNNAIITGNVYFDDDGDSNTTSDQSGLSGITINLLNSDGTSTLDTTTTRSDGSYQFTINLSTQTTYRIEQIDTGGAYTDASPAISFPDSNGAASANSSGNDQITSIIVDPGDQLTDYNFYETSLSGTNSSETLDGGTGDDFIIGYKGQDTLTGGSGNDTFFYNETSEGVDVITDFTSGSDEIDISQILANETDYSTGNPFDQGYAILTDYPVALGGGVMVQIDFDGPGSSTLVKSVVLLENSTNNLTAAGVDINGSDSSDTDFIF